MSLYLLYNLCSINHVITISIYFIQTNIFKTEMIMYMDLVPKLSKLEPGLKGPLTYYGDNDEGVMLMENLKKVGYGIIGKEKGITGNNK